MSLQKFIKFDKRAIGYFIPISSVIIFFLIPYLYFYPFVGSFPSENLSDGLSDSHFFQTLCLSGDLHRGTDSKLETQLTTNSSSTHNSFGPTHAKKPELSLKHNTNPLQANILDQTKSLYFASSNNKIIALDIVNTDDIALLKLLATQGFFSTTDLDTFLNNSRSYYLPCNATMTDQGVAEGYWASKGASVLHHWTHLYEANMSGHVHAQYGFLVPWISYHVLDWSSSLGPTNFVRLAWIIFACCGLAYIAVFVYLFRDYPQLTIAALLAKLFFYSKVGSFMLVLAPGYHWFRELVLILVPTILLAGTSHYSPIGIRRNLPMIMAVSVLLAICYFIDPIFFLIGILCALLATFLSNSLFVYEYIKQNRILFLIILLALSVVLILIADIQSSNLLYVIDKLQSGNLGSTKYVKRIALTCLAAIIFLFLLKNNRHKFLASYFAFVTLASSLYYFLTPDSFHFYVFSEYAIPFALLLVLSISERFKIRFPSRLHLSPTLLTLTKTLLFIIIATITVKNFLPHTPYPEFSLRSSNGEPYFHSKDYIINNRLINANLSENIAEHLRTFPASLSPDFILSPYDKYLTFLYDRVNGFETPDLIASLDSDKKLKEALQLIAKPNHPVTVLVDDAMIDVDTRQGIKRSNPILGKQYDVSILHLKAQLRAAELADALFAKCTESGNVALPIGWHILRCAN